MFKRPVVFHFRNEKINPFGKPVVCARGGGTVVYDPVSNCFSIALCHNRDNFNKKTGLQIALNRLKCNKNGRFNRLYKSGEIPNSIEEIKRIASFLYEKARSVLPYSETK